MRNQDDPGTPDLITGRLLLGYARVSTDDQDLTHQRAELHAAGCTRIYAEKITGTRRDRPELDRMLDHLRAGDVVTVTRLDRLARATEEHAAKSAAAAAQAGWKQLSRQVRTFVAQGGFLFAMCTATRPATCCAATARPAAVVTDVPFQTLR